MDKKYSLKGEYEVLLSKSEMVINKSKFIAYVYNVQNADQISKIIKNIETTNKEAKHIVYAYRLENTRKIYGR